MILVQMLRLEQAGPLRRCGVISLAEIRVIWQQDAVAFCVLCRDFERCMMVSSGIEGMDAQLGLEGYAKHQHKGEDNRGI